MTSMPPSSIPPPSIEVQTLAIEIADEQSVWLIERYAERSHLVHHTAIWDVGAVDQAELDPDETVDMVAADLKRAVIYLDMREMLDRPVAGQPHLVAIRSA